ncbi:MAG: hypothetical protein PVH61_00425 [Candidatus Aminicenantes bacterium]
MENLVWQQKLPGILPQRFVDKLIILQFEPLEITQNGISSTLSQKFCPLFWQYKMLWDLLMKWKKLQNTISEITNSPIGLKNIVWRSSPKAFKNCPKETSLFVICTDLLTSYMGKKLQTLNIRGFLVICMAYCRHSTRL